MADTLDTLMAHLTPAMLSCALPKLHVDILQNSAGGCSCLTGSNGDFGTFHMPFYVLCADQLSRGHQEAALKLARSKQCQHCPTCCIGGF